MILLDNPMNTNKYLNFNNTNKQVSIIYENVFKASCWNESV